MHMLLFRCFSSRPAFVLIPGLLLGLILGSCTGGSTPESPIRGEMRLVADPGLLSVASMQSELFTRYYPDARVVTIGADSLSALNSLLSGRSKAALTLRCPSPDAGKLTPSLRVEPVARDAVVLVVNENSPLTYISKEAVFQAFSGMRADGDNGLLPLIAADDTILRELLDGGDALKGRKLQAYGCRSQQEMLQRVAGDSHAVGIILRSAFQTARADHAAPDKLRLLAVSADAAGAEPVTPDPENILNGSYPFVAEVCYIYYSGEALPAGFGAWLSAEGQKAFENGPLVPYRQRVRTIILSAKQASDPL
ncbi:PstS family phosphate ABC transporter substrate-binding protein [Pelodictyon luteolum]|uniref:Phosphate ABC transporter substrate-binding protein, PhoT family n=1 Tax=Chlorobium luteolum (strain DSM 273 / BCRC 81028 / 2530) TaxID=319225 RepID=Q3B419_CHLL3|nr:substrate-binding domain-containing protein [Pelodictyon luteolum]ABB23912.1 phosphate ABC transporter substrate-binding protein, PhoT family [Pelodictyon luteolum DSM 273]